MAAAHTHDPPPPVPDWSEATACAWCGASLHGAPERRAGRTRCGACGAWTTDPRPSPGSLTEAYGPWYRPERGRFAGPGDAILRVTRGALARRLDATAPPGRILDVGAGDGALLKALARRGRPAFGVEREARWPGIVANDLGDVEGRWAAVVFWHTLEHLPDPPRALAHARRLLDSDGVLLIAVPNVASLQARAFGDRWLGLDLPRHLVHLPATALLSRLRALGLRVERVSHARGGQVVFGWLHGLVGTLPGGLDLYAAIRRPEARERPLVVGRRAAALAAGAVLLPVASLAAVLEVLERRGGSLYVEARARQPTGERPVTS